LSPLEEYRRKRDFARTPEPPGSEKGRHGVFTVQKHAARRLHYDLRLELDGVLKSWAVPKGPSLDPEEKRLAVEVEDHPIEYADFEGTIPKGEYGGGSVLLWDRGTWTPRGDAHRALASGKLHFRLHGDKLRGEWLLVRTSSSPDKPQWLLRKLSDAAAQPGTGDAVLRERPESALSGLHIDEIPTSRGRVWSSGHTPDRAEELASLAGAIREPLPDFVSPQLASLVQAAPEGAGWIHELKLDGYRIQARVDGGEVTLRSRRGHDWTDRMPRIAEESARLPVDRAILDGEVVALRADGAADFQALQNSLGREEASAPLYYVVFDLLYLDGYDLQGVALLERKRLAHRLLVPPPASTERLRYSDHVVGQGPAFFAQACRVEVEGVVSKRADARYRPGRGRDWVKIKCASRQEFVIVGATRPRGARTGFGALLLAYHDETGRLVFAGRVGTGFDQATLDELTRRLGALARPTPPTRVSPGQVRKGEAMWVEPRLVAEVRFAGWTRDGLVRHSSFEGLREDKDPADVVLERAAPTPPARAPRAPEVPLTHPGRVYFPEAGITKRGLVRYYERVGELMLPHVEGRPLTLLRCPEGVGGECFYQKHLAEGVPSTLSAASVEERDGTLATYVTADSIAGLATLAQLGCLEIHPWGSRTSDLHHPDRLIFDLDPSADVGWDRVVATAFELRDILSALGLESFVRLTGGKGLHVVVPIAPELAWPKAKALTRAIALLVADRNPGLYTINPLKERRGGRIYIDYLRNGFGATAIASYSTRARADAPIALPIDWNELSPEAKPVYTVTSMAQRLRDHPGDPWAPMLTLDQRLDPAIRERLTKRA
jgi:bifunctional non-homologous end joining protein LigD